MAHAQGLLTLIHCNHIGLNARTKVRSASDNRSSTAGL